MLCVRRIHYCLQEIGVARGAADIFWWTSILSIQTEMAADIGASSVTAFSTFATGAYKRKPTVDI